MPSKTRGNADGEPKATAVAATVTPVPASGVTATAVARATATTVLAAPADDDDGKPKRSALSQRFDLHLDLLREFKAANSGADPPRDYVVQKDGVPVNLGKWCMNQRQRKAKGQLAADRVERLSALHFSWGSVTESVWNEYYTLLKSYKEEHEASPKYSCTVQVGDKVLNLGVWCRTQRYRFHGGKLSATRVEKLKEINFDFGVTTFTSFNEHFDALVEYKKTHGGKDAPRHFSVTSPKGRTLNVGTWCDRQRRRKAQNKLDPERLERLESIGFNWVVKARTGSKVSWTQQYEELKRFKEANGKEPPRKYIARLADGRTFNLGKWCDTQRWHKKKNRLLPHREEKLREINFRWQHNVSATFEEYLEALRAYKETHDRDPPTTYSATTEDGRILNVGSWCKTQRKSKKRGTLWESREQALSDIGFQWVVSRSVAWEEYFEALVAYKEKHGSIDLPNTLITTVRDGRRINLGGWCHRMLRKHADGELDERYVRKLTEVGFVWKTTRGKSASWMEMYSELQTFKEENGRDRDPSRNFVVTKPDGRKLRLGKWCDTQRQAKKNYRLTEERTARLDAVGFRWNCNVMVDWKVYFDVLKEYKLANNGKDPMANFHHYLPDGRRLLVGQWCMNQRKAKKKGTLTAERQQLLDSLGFVWVQVEPSWEESFEEYKKYFTSHSRRDPSWHYRVNLAPGKVAKPGRWADSQRQLKRLNKLREDRVNTLNSIGFDWDVPTPPVARKSSSKATAASASVHAYPVLAQAARSVGNVPRRNRTAPKPAAAVAKPISRFAAGEDGNPRKRRRGPKPVVAAVETVGAEVVAVAAESIASTRPKRTAAGRAKST